MDTLLDSPDQSTKQGQRDRALLLFLYNSGARATEAASVKVGDFEGNEHGGVVKLHEIAAQLQW